MNKTYIGLLSAVLNASTMIPYAVSVIKGKARPSRATWLIWTFLSSSIFLASVASGANATAFWMGSAVLNAVFVTCLSFWRGTWDGIKLEYFCLGLGFLGVAIWVITNEAYYSVYVSMIVNVIAVIPLIRNVWRKPHVEPKAAWTIGFIAALFNVLAIDSYNPVVVLPPLVVVCWHLPILYPMYFMYRK